MFTNHQVDCDNCLFGLLHDAFILKCRANIMCARKKLRVNGLKYCNSAGFQ